MNPVIDAHHHIWRQADLPWLTGPMQPRIFGPYEPIRRDYGLAEYLADAAGLGLAGSVYVQANWAPDAGLAEARWVRAEADAAGWPMAIVAHAEMTSDAGAAQIEALASVPGVAGVRQQLHWHPNPEYRFAPHADLCADPVLRRNLARLPGLGWCFDLQVFPGQFAGAEALVDALPDVTFVLVHAGMPEDADAGAMAHWQAGLERLGARGNVMCKLSGLGTFRRHLDTAHVAEVVQAALAAFGPQRCLWGSNFPIEKLWTTMPAQFAAYRAALAGLDAAGQRAVLHDTAARLYRLA